MGLHLTPNNQGKCLNIQITMYLLAASLTLLASATASPLKVTSAKAASPYVNIGCQCSPLTFQDQYGAIQGNCRAADSTGARWCYVDNAHSSSCQDKRFSARFPNNPWSYEACATPLPVAVGPIAPSAAFTAPVGPSYGQNIPTYGHPASGPISSGFGSSGYGSGYGSGFGSGYGSAGSLYGSNLGTLQPYGEIIPKSSSDKDAVKF